MGASRVNNDAAELAEREARTAARDLSELERAHVALLESEERFRLLSQLAPVGIVQTDLDGSCTFANDRWCELTGMTAQEAIGAGWTASLHPDDIERVAREWERAAATDGELRTDCRLRSAGPDPVWVHIAVVPFLAADGRACGFLAAVTNVSERKRAEAEKEKRNARLRELDEAKTQFISTMSHELRTPLTSIVSFTELIMDDEHELSEETVGSLSVIQRNAERLLRLVGDLLLLNRLEAGVIPLELAAVSVPDLVAEAARSASATAADRGITVQVSAAAGPAVQADRLRLQQVVDNLLSNAIKFSRQDGRILVEAAHDGRRWRIDVADDGIGIPADELGGLFGRFVRASNARTAGLPGTGLGLSVVKAITELHGGSVAVRSTVGHGTTFSVYLPISQ